ncbi:hypothetical protein AB0J72_22860 [Dactylosporangium sp. NPDC049742]|uniref:hypothetical protein n=1 Tax=Dactylosporangium sp. NPDC049742 TaxID=3154737 RepID=UPI00343B98B8
MTAGADGFALAVLEHHLGNARAEAYRILQLRLASCVLDLHVATAAGTGGYARDLHALTAAITHSLDRVRADEVHFGTLSQLQGAALHLRFLHREAETADTGNPLYNVTIWLLRQSAPAPASCTPTRPSPPLPATTAPQPPPPLQPPTRRDVTVCGRQRRSFG